MTQDLFDPLFELQDGRLEKLGNPLIELEQSIIWEAYRPLPNQIHKRTGKTKQEQNPEML